MIWDLPTRLFHWLLVICVFGAFISVDGGYINAHEKFGLTILGLVIFRIIWGVIGHPPSRFAYFTPRLSSLKTYLQHHQQDKPGHNPLGALSVITILVLLLIQTLTGNFSTDDILYDGPLRHFAPDWSGLAYQIHEITRLLIILIGVLHISAILVHRLKFKEKLVSRMITGGHDNQLPQPTWRHQLTGLCLMALCVTSTHLLVLLRPY
ncbi:MAG: cytochrome b/b6 domain-containing protein [Parvibaculales bacterium]